MLTGGGSQRLDIISKGMYTLISLNSFFCFGRNSKCWQEVNIVFSCVFLPFFNNWWSATHLKISHLLFLCPRTVSFLSPQAGVNDAHMSSWFQNCYFSVTFNTEMKFRAGIVGATATEWSYCTTAFNPICHSSLAHVFSASNFFIVRPIVITGNNATLAQQSVVAS